MEFTNQFFNLHYGCHITRTYTLTNEVETKPRMYDCIEHFFKHLSDQIQPQDVKITRQAPTKDGCRYHIAFSYIDPVTRRVQRRTSKYTINPMTRELYVK